MEVSIFGVQIDLLQLVFLSLLFGAVLLTVSIAAICFYKKKNLVVPDPLDDQVVDRMNEKTAQDIEMAKTIDRMFAVQRPSDRYKIEGEQETEV